MQVARTKKTINPRKDPPITISADEARLRFNQDGIEEITDVIRNYIMPSTGRNNSVTAHVQFMVTLRYYAKCS